MTQDTDDFLEFYNNGAEDTATEVEESKEEVTTEEKAVEEEKPEESSEEHSSEEVKAEKGLLAKAQDEKKKRQELEKQLDEMKAQIEKLSQSKQPEAEAPKITEPDTLDEGYTPYIKSLITNEVIKVKTELSRENAIEKWGDEFIEAEKFFMDNANEADIAQALNASNPAKHVFDVVKKHKEQQKLQDPDYAKKLEAELREKILKELKGETPKPKLESKSILGKGSVAIKDQSSDDVDVFDLYDKESAFNY